MRRRDLLAGAAVIASASAANAFGVGKLGANFGGGGQVLLGGGAPSWAPGASVALDFANSRYYGGSLSSLLSISRASTGYAQTAAGVLVPFAANTLRITDQGLLVEEARTNLALQSNGFSTTWGGTGSPTITPGAAVSPDGSLNAWLFTRTTTASTNLGQNIVKAASALSYTYTFYVAQSVGNYFALRLQGIYPSRADVVFNIANGTISSAATATATFASASATISSPILIGGKQFYRVSLTATSSTDTNISPYFSFNSNNGQIDGIDSVSNSAGYIFGADVQLGSFATSYIPTTTASATRAADVPQLIGSALTAALNAKAAFFQTTGVAGGTTPRLGDFNGTQFFGFNTSTVARASNGTNNADATIAASGTYANLVKSAFGFDSSSITARANGGTQATAANAWGAPSGAVYLGNRAAGDLALNGYMQRFALSLTKGAFDGMTA